MNAAPRRSLWALTAAAGLAPQRRIADSAASLAFAELAGATTLGADPAQLRGRAILLHTRHQLAAALALLELDGLASRIILCPPDLNPALLPAIIEKSGADLILSDHPTQADHGIPVLACGLPPAPQPTPERDIDTEFLLFTSGTTGMPKLAAHSLAGLIGAIQPAQPERPIWSTFYDIRRYGGLQILLRAFTGGGAMLLSDPREDIAAFLTRLGAAGVQRLSGTPSHWRSALMSPAIARIAPAYVRLSGEIADQIILTQLKTTFPAAIVAHAFASTEAGVAFEVRDGLPGFPASWIGQMRDGVEMRIQSGSLHIRSARTATAYAGDPTRPLKDADGFVDTGDIMTLRAGRYCFAGRREGVINVGGLKVHPEEVEAIINLHPFVRMSRVKAKPNPITGAVVIAEIVLHPSAQPAPTLHAEILTACREALPPHKVPALLREVPHLELSAAGKLSRHIA